MLMTAICGFIQIYFPCGMYKASPRLKRPPGFYKHMTIVGCTRFVTVVLGLVSLNYVAVSFTETIKSSAPLFTVLISRYLLGENCKFICLELSKIQFLIFYAQLYNNNYDYI